MKLTVRSRNGLVCLGAVLLVLFTGIQTLSATMLVVGNCKPGGYPTIQQAINAAPVGAKVQVCPGNYFEQVKITRAVTLQGITDNSGQTAQIYPPTSGLVANATNAYGRSVSAQVLVENSAGAVNISGLYISGEGHAVAAGDVAGIFYQNSPGTVNGVSAWVQDDDGVGFGVGIWLEGGAAKPSVTIQNCLIVDSSYASILVETSDQHNTDLTAKIANNLLGVPDIDNASGVLAASGATVTITGNSVTGNNMGYGFWIGPGVTGSVSDNDMTTTAIGIETYADAVSITSNKFSFNAFKGIDLQTAVGEVKSNVIVYPFYIAIEFNCIANPNVRSNTINNALFVGLDQVPSGVNTSTNKIFVTGTARTGC